MKKLSLGRSKKLNNKHQFKLFFGTSEVFRLPYAVGFRGCVVFRIPNNKGKLRLGMTIKGKVVNSVIRSSIKRVVRESFRVYQHELESYDYNVVLQHKPLPAENSPFNFKKKFKNTNKIDDIFLKNLKVFLPQIVNLIINVNKQRHAQQQKA